jgi:hypothetical protein
MQRYFTLAEAERTLARIAPELRRALALRNEMRVAEAELQDVARKVTLSGGFAVNRDKVAATKRDREQILERLQEIVEGIQETGCIVKDLDTGLLDFPTLYHGREVYLCWHADEDKIAFWHDVEAGFRGRKPIDDEFLANHRGAAN